MDDSESDSPITGKHSEGYDLPKVSHWRSTHKEQNMYFMGTQDKLEQLFHFSYTSVGGVHQKNNVRRE